jgi:hypothetical protein
VTVPRILSPPLIPWVRALLQFATLVQPLGVEWMIVGSGATAVRGVALVFDDLDVLVSTPQDVASVAAVMPSIEDDEMNADPTTFLSTRARPIPMFGDGTWRSGDVEVEVAHIHSPPS